MGTPVTLIRALADLKDPANNEGCVFSLGERQGITILRRAHQGRLGERREELGSYDGAWGDVTVGGGLGRSRTCVEGDLETLPDVPSFLLWEARTRPRPRSGCQANPLRRSDRPPLTAALQTGPRWLAPRGPFVLRSRCLGRIA